MVHQNPAANPTKAVTRTCQELIEMYVAGPPDVVRAIGDEPILTDDKPVIEYFLSIPQDEQALDVSRLPRRPSDIVRP